MILPLVSLVMPFHGECEFLVETLNSLRAQSCNKLEYIFIADRASERASQQVLDFLRDQRGQLISSPSAGIVSALNHGLSRSQGKYIARLDSDDCATQLRFDKQLEAFENDNSLVIVGSDIETIDSKSNSLGTKKFPRSDPKIREYMKFSNPFAHPAVMFSKEVAISCGGYMEGFPGAEDYELWTRLMNFGKGLNLAESLTKYRIHPQQITKKYSESGIIVGGFISMRIAGEMPNDQPVIETYDDLQQFSKSSRITRNQLAIAELVLSRNHDFNFSSRIFLSFHAFILSPKPCIFFAKLRLYRLINRFFSNVVNPKRRGV